MARNWKPVKMLNILLFRGEKNSDEGVGGGNGQKRKFASSIVTKFNRIFVRKIRIEYVGKFSKDEAMIFFFLENLKKFYESKICNFTPPPPIIIPNSFFSWVDLCILLLFGLRWKFQPFEYENAEDMG